MKALSLDSSVVVRWILQDPNWQAVDALIESELDLFLPGPVLTEVLSVARRRGNSSTTEQLYSALLGVGFRPEPTCEADLYRAAELLIMSDQHVERRADRPYSLSLGDALALAVTERLGCDILTSDRHWSWLADRDLLRITVHQL